MALFDINVDSVDDILSIRTSIIQGNFTTNGGLTVVNWTSEGTTVSKAWAISPSVLLSETLEYLRSYDSGAYGKNIKRTTPYYMS